MSVLFLSGPIGAGKTTVAKALLPLLPAPLSYIEGDTFWRFIQNSGHRGVRENFPVLAPSMTAAAIPFDFVLLRSSRAVCAQRAASREEGAIADYDRVRDFYARFEDGTVQSICDDFADPASLARRIADGLEQGRFRVL